MRVLPMVVAVVVTAGGTTAQDDRLGPQASIDWSTLRAEERFPEHSRSSRVMPSTP